MGENPHWFNFNAKCKIPLRNSSCPYQSLFHYFTTEENVRNSHLEIPNSYRMKSLSYYLTLLVIKGKGVKREFSKNPIDYKKLRKENVMIPSLKQSASFNCIQFSVEGSEISEIKQVGDSEAIILYCHGGAFVYGPVDYHWEAIKALAVKTGNAVWMVNYPKAPEHCIKEISQSISAVYAAALRKHPLKKIILIGDSVGATLISALVQRLDPLKQALPSLLVLISPVMDASFSNPQISSIDKEDPILSRAGALSAKEMAAGSLDLKDPLLSPLYGSFKNFPSTILFIAEKDISRPDQELTVKKMQEQNVELEVIYGKGMPHIWPILPVMKEAKYPFAEVISRIKNLESKN